MLRKSKPLILLAAVIAVCQPTVAQEPAPGTLLISTPALAGTMFAQTVMLVVHHDDDGSIAIMLNRPTNLRPAAVFPDIEGAGSYTGVVYFGGPLSPARPYMLLRRSAGGPEPGLRIIEDVYLSADAALLSTLDPALRAEHFFRFYAGSAQWGPGQLVAEIDAGAWETSIAGTEVIFTNTPAELWQRLLAAPRGTDVAALPDTPVRARTTLAAR